MCTLDRLACVCTTGVQLPWADREALGGPGRGGGGSGDLPQDPHLPQGRGRSPSSLLQSVVSGKQGSAQDVSSQSVKAYVRKHASTCIREVAKHTPELAQLIVSNGGAGALVDYVIDSEGNNRLPGIMALGFIAAFSETLALSVIASKGKTPLPLHPPPYTNAHHGARSLSPPSPRPSRYRFKMGLWGVCITGAREL
eukprot:1179110-Prorocentrum_minimum.AAC.4